MKIDRKMNLVSQETWKQIYTYRILRMTELKLYRLLYYNIRNMMYLKTMLCEACTKNMQL